MFVCFDLNYKLYFCRKYNYMFLNTLSPRFKSFCSSLKSLDTGWRLNLKPNFKSADDSLCHMIDSCQLLGPTWGVRPKKIKPTMVGFIGELISMLSLILNKSLESANSNHENPPNTILNWAENFRIWYP